MSCPYTSPKKPSIETLYIAEGKRHRAEGRRQKLLRKSRVSTIKNVLITLAVAIYS
jgi:hypothetical protein